MLQNGTKISVLSCDVWLFLLKWNDGPSDIAWRGGITSLKSSGLDFPGFVPSMKNLQVLNDTCVCQP